MSQAICGCIPVLTAMCLELILRLLAAGSGVGFAHVDVACSTLVQELASQAAAQDNAGLSALCRTLATAVLPSCSALHGMPQGCCVP